MLKICFVAGIVSVMTTILEMSCSFIAWSILYLMAKNIHGVIDRFVNDAICYDIVKDEAVIFFIYSSGFYIGFYFGFTFLLLYWWCQWRGIWHCDHMTYHMMWCYKA